MGIESDPFLNAALARAAEGWAVHPLFGIVAGACECGRKRDCPTPGKHPRLPGWQEKATTDRRTIEAWWQRWPHANIGGATGKKSGRNVLDIDPRHGGDLSLEALESTHGRLPETHEVITGSGGGHRYFTYGGSLSNTAGILGPGLDIRSDGGNLVLPGSRHLSGRGYEYEITHGPDDLAIADIPEWLLRLLSSQRQTHVRPAPGRIPNGTAHHTFVSWAGTMHHRGFSPGAILAALRHENETRCDPIRPEANIRKIVEDITTRYEPGDAPTPMAAHASRAAKLRQEAEETARRILAKQRGGAV
jgi:putative DNA primase/helicase